MALALKKALSTGNIKSGFEGTWILPLKANAVDGQLAPSRVFESIADEEGIVAESPLDGVASEARLVGAANSEQARMQTTESSGEERLTDRDVDPLPTHVEQERDDDGDGNSEATESIHIEIEMAAEPSSQA